MNDKQHALAAEIRAEAAAQRMTAKHLQAIVGVSSSAWANYFNTCTRDVPMSVVVDVAEALGMTGSELLQRAEARAVIDSPSVNRTTDELEAGLSASSRRALEKARAEHGVADVADPPKRARERTRRSA